MKSEAPLNSKDRFQLGRFLFIYCYRILFFPIFLILLPHYLLRMWRRGGYARGFWHRFGFCPRSKKSNTWWIQAVSVGEVEALEPLLSRLKGLNISVYLTTTTSTGFKIARTKYSQYVDNIAYFPLDFFLFSKLAWHRIHPSVVLLMESELWPEHLYQAAKHHTPIYLINGRCSDKSFAHYRKCLPIARILLGSLTKIFAISSLDAERFRELCPQQVSIQTLGNLKIDAALNKLKLRDGLKRSDLGQDWKKAMILIGASTWPGEEAFLLRFFQKARLNCPHLRLILVPRHVERTEEIRVLLRDSPYKCCFHTSPQQDTDIYVVNTTGELAKFISISDFVFVGKSLPPNQGGQTPLEAAAQGKAIVYGPHMQNFHVLCSSLETEGGSYRCQNETEVEACLNRWLEDIESTKTMGMKARLWCQNHSGITNRLITLLSQELKQIRF